MSDALPDYWDCFSADYATARQAFVAVAAERGAALSRHEHPTLKDPRGQPLSVDVAVLGRPDAPRTHLAISGTHGLEGAAGSAVQIGWLRADGGNPLPDDVNVVLVHALNPYGYAYDTRTTENNVDLNRNFIDHTRPTPPNPHYATLHPHLIPDAWTEASLEAGARAVEAFRETHGADALFNTTASGQYTHPDGLVYGGSGPEWSNRTLRRIVDEHLAASERVAFIDWHTGIGEYGEPFFLCFNDEGSAEQAQAARWWGAERVRDQRPHGLARPDYQGLVFRGVQQALGDRALAGAVVEFGTRGLQMRPALRLDQWLRFKAPHAPDAARDAQLRADLVDAFVPVSSVWRRSALAHGLAITRQAIAGVAAW
nr:M14 family metallopeptidase [uncultured Achromobacter sp.]